MSPLTLVLMLFSSFAALGAGVVQVAVEKDSMPSLFIIVLSFFVAMESLGTYMIGPA